MVSAPPTSPEDPADALAAVGALRRLADRVEDATVTRAAADGWSWAQIAEALGVTRQAVHKKHARRVADATTTRGGR
jgi:DNA-directed RNA polymerase specialized sigma24 family protein